MSDKFFKLPKDDEHYIMVKDYVEEVPLSDYRLASDEARERFMDLKYGVRIHWGLYSVIEQHWESWPFLMMNHQDKQEYSELYKRFNPTGFDADEWMDLFKRSGVKCFAFTTKHHEGFSMYDTKTRVKKHVNWVAEGGPQIEDCDMAYSVMDSPFKRDIVKELCDAAHKNDIAINLYYSHPDWHDADFRPYCGHPILTPNLEKYNPKPDIEKFKTMRAHTAFAQEPTEEETNRAMKRHRDQIIEILSNYGKIDMMCLDMWFGEPVWEYLRETIKIARDLQPDVMLRARGIGNYGDYHTPEGFVPGKEDNTDMPWMCIYPLPKNFSYDPDASNYKGSIWIIRNLIDTVSKGGNFMVGIGPDGEGRWHPVIVNDLEETGRWLEVNGEAIYCTRPREGELYKEGNVRFTRSKDKKYVYAISLLDPGKELVLKTVQPNEGSEIKMLGVDQPLKWEYTSDKGVRIILPESRPCTTAYSFKIEQI